MLKCGFLSAGTGEFLVVSELGSGQERLIWPQHMMVQRWEMRAGRRSGGCYSSSVFALLISDTSRHCQSTWSSYNLLPWTSHPQLQHLPLPLEKFIYIGHLHCFTSQSFLGPLCSDTTTNSPFPETTVMRSAIYFQGRSRE